jgi:flagellar FliJ protein
MDKEEEVKRELGKAVNVLNTLENKLTEVMNKKKDFDIMFSESLNKGISAHDLAYFNSYVDVIKKEIINAKEDISKKKEEIGLIKRQLHEAMKKRKIMEKIKENDHEAFMEEEKLKEAKEIDEIVTYMSSKSEGD